MQRCGGLINGDLELLPPSLGDNFAEFAFKEPPSPDFVRRHIQILQLLPFSSLALKLAVRDRFIKLIWDAH